MERKSYLEGMLHVLVPVFTAADVAAVPQTVKLLRLLKPLAVVVVNNPSLGITSETATQEVDKQIADLERAKADAASREDYEGAKAFKMQIEDAKMKRVDILREGWKQVSPEARGQTYDKLFVDEFTKVLGPLGVYVANLPLTEDATPENLLSTLANFGTAWPKCLPHSQYAIIWPQSVTPITVPVAAPEPVSAPPKVVTAPKPSKSPVAAPASPREAREKKLKQYFTLKSAAQEHGIPMEGRSGADVREQILAIEFPEAAVA